MAFIYRRSGSRMERMTGRGFWSARRFRRKGQHLRCQTEKTEDCRFICSWTQTGKNRFMKWHWNIRKCFLIREKDDILEQQRVNMLAWLTSGDSSPWTKFMGGWAKAGNERTACVSRQKSTLARVRECTFGDQKGIFIWNVEFIIHIEKYLDDIKSLYFIKYRKNF